MKEFIDLPEKNERKEPNNKIWEQIILRFVGCNDLSAVYNPLFTTSTL